MGTNRMWHVWAIPFGFSESNANTKIPIEMRRYSKWLELLDIESRYVAVKMPLCIRKTGESTAKRTSEQPSTQKKKNRHKNNAKWRRAATQNKTDLNGTKGTHEHPTIMHTHTTIDSNKIVTISIESMLVLSPPQECFVHAQLAQISNHLDDHFNRHLETIHTIPCLRCYLSVFRARTHSHTKWDILTLSAFKLAYEATAHTEKNQNERDRAEANKKQ